MPTEIDILCCAGLLLLVHILLPARFKTQQYGTKWNVGARDEVLPPLNPIAGRLERARDNFLETLPVAIIALVGAVLTNRTSSLTAIAGWTWLGARIAYLPLYWAGIPVLRTIVWCVSVAALLLMLWALYRH